MTRRKSLDLDDLGYGKRHNKANAYDANGSINAKKVFLSDSFQEIMTVKLFGLNVSVSKKRDTTLSCLVLHRA